MVADIECPHFQNLLIHPWQICNPSIVRPLSIMFKNCLQTGKRQMLYLSIKNVTIKCCTISAQSRYCQYVVKFSKELSSTKCLNFLKKRVFSVHTNLDFVHLTHIKVSYYPLFMTSMLLLIKLLPLKWEQTSHIYPKHLIKYSMRGYYLNLRVLEYQEMS